MNVKPGDLAMCVEGDFEGSTCSVLASAGVMRYRPTGESMAMWLVAFSRPMNWIHADDPDNTSEGAYPDNWLRKISGQADAESTDEAIRKLKKQSSDHVVIGKPELIPV